MGKLLIDSINESLESNIESFSEANELLEFAKGEWSSLKDKCEKIGIDILDDGRRSAEQNLAESIQALELGDLELCLDKLGELDKVMEKMKDTMEQTVELNIPLIAEAAIGSNWNEAH